ncbi:hypothetical protein BJX66DRAFT_316961 [Aspergillus keveii]|uniref:BZIP domain-containing protein n=1 Tax=Aspergillus keveii TaxID=714993 RepID=A0ABR4FLZ4_9EURO
MMENSVTPLSLTLGEGEAHRISDQHAHCDEEAEANKQRRKVQNRKNQRARRLRIRVQDPRYVQPARLFQVRRWRLDETDELPFPDTLSPSKSATVTYISPRSPHSHIQISASMPKHAGMTQEPPPTALIYTQTSLTRPPVIFPLSTDHLLHLVLVSPWDGSRLRFFVQIELAVKQQTIQIPTDTASGRIMGLHHTKLPVTIPGLDPYYRHESRKSFGKVTADP